MRPVYRIGTMPDAVSVERWSGWAAFDAGLDRPGPFPSDLAYAAEDPPASAWQGAGIVELQRVRVQAGRNQDGAGLLAQDRTAWEATGATVIGLFPVVHGDDLPACLLLLRWPSLVAALDGLAATEADAGPTGRRREDRLVRGTAAIRGSARLFRPRLTFETLG